MAMRSSSSAPGGPESDFTVGDPEQKRAEFLKASIQTRPRLSKSPTVRIVAPDLTENLPKDWVENLYENAVDEEEDDKIQEEILANTVNGLLEELETRGTEGVSRVGLMLKQKGKSLYRTAKETFMRDRNITQGVGGGINVYDGKKIYFPKTGLEAGGKRLLRDIFGLIPGGYFTPGKAGATDDLSPEQFTLCLLDVRVAQLEHLINRMFYGTKEKGGDWIQPWVMEPGGLDFKMKTEYLKRREEDAQESSEFLDGITSLAQHDPDLSHFAQLIKSTEEISDPEERGKAIRTILANERLKQMKGGILMNLKNTLAEQYTSGKFNPDELRAEIYRLYPTSIQKMMEAEKQHLSLIHI